MCKNIECKVTNWPPPLKIQNRRVLVYLASVVRNRAPPPKIQIVLHSFKNLFVKTKSGVPLR